MVKFEEQNLWSSPKHPQVINPTNPQTEILKTRNGRWPVYLCGDHAMTALGLVPQLRLCFLR
jgi:hypothetical protein